MRSIFASMSLSFLVFVSPFATASGQHPYGSSAHGEGKRPSSSVSPDIAKGGPNHHWHAVNEQHAPRNVVFMDVHRIRRNEKLDTSTTHLVAFLPKTQHQNGLSVDYMITEVEYNCKANNVERTLAVGIYGVVNGKSVLVEHVLTPSSWNRETGFLYTASWVMACKGVIPKKSLPSNQGFEWMLKEFRASMPTEQQLRERAEKKSDEYFKNWVDEEEEEDF